MPELPEVETVKCGLSVLLVGHIVKDISFDWPKSFPNAATDVKEFLIGAEIVAVRRRAKVLLIDLSSSYTLVIHLKMTGQLVYVKNPNSKSQVTNNNQTSKTQDPKRLGFSARDLVLSEPAARFGAGHPTDSLVGELPDRSTRVMFELDKGAVLFFNDQRKFGWVKLYPTIEVPNIDFMKKVGPEPLDDDFRCSMFESRLQKRKNSMIKAVLLDQTVIAGVGNIYADESLWGAKIHPATKVADIPKYKIKNLYTELLAVLRLAIEKGGSTDKNYVNAEGKRGSYIDFARVFRKEGTPCQRHPNSLIEKIKVASRGTHICPTCQIVGS